jgi:hypothetical protein
MDGGDWDAVLRTNLDSFYNVLQPVTMPMVRRRAPGRIVTVASVAGIIGNRGQTNYSASKGRLIAAAFLIPYFLVAVLFPPWDVLFVVAFLIALPFLVVKARQFSLRMTSWRNIRFDFTGTYGRAAGVYLGLMALSMLTLGLLAPYWTYARQRFLIGQTRFGTTQLEFRARASAYYSALLLGGAIAFLDSVFPPTTRLRHVSGTRPKAAIRSAARIGNVSTRGARQTFRDRRHSAPHRFRCAGSIRHSARPPSSALRTRASAPPFRTPSTTASPVPRSGSRGPFPC